MNYSIQEWCWFLHNHSMFLTHILFVVSSDPYMFFSYTHIHPIFVLLVLDLYKHIFLLSFNPNYDRFTFPMHRVIQSFITIFQKIKTTSNLGPTNLIHTFFISLSGTSIKMLNRLTLRTSLYFSQII